MNIARQKKILSDRYAALTEHLNKLERSLEQTPPKDWEDRSSERQGDEVIEGLGKLELEERAHIKAALARIDKGTYGVCQRCGEAISDERLELLPQTAFCKVCA
jgi:RNA polymerase-binding transcription factor DksA